MLRHAIDLLLSPLEEPFQRYLDVCDDIHACDTSGNTLLHWAAAIGNFSAAYALLQRGVAVDACNVHGATALLVAAALCPNAATLGYLLVSHGASLDATLEDSSVSVQSLLEARRLEHLWGWLRECERGIRRGKESAWWQFQGSSELPAADGLASRVLCSLSTMKQLRVHTNECRLSSVVMKVKDAPAVSVPRPPPRDYPAQSSLARTGEGEAAFLTATPQPDGMSSVLFLRGELLEAQETAQRLQVENEQLEALLDLSGVTATLPVSAYESEEDGSWSGPLGGNSEDRSSERALMGQIQAVLGERIDADGRHHLLLQYREPDSNDGGSEAWHFADSVKADPVVRAHLARTFSATTSADASEAKTPSIMTLRNAGSPLETWEREQLEAQLRLLPRRALQSLEEGSPVDQRQVSASLISPAPTSLRHATTPIMTDFVWNEHLSARSCSDNRRHQANAFSPFPLQSHSSLSALPSLSSPLGEKERASWRFAPGHPRQYEGMSDEAVYSADSIPVSRQLLLSDRWQGRNPMAGLHLEVDGNTTATAAAAVPVQSVTPASVKSVAGTSDLSNDTLRSFSPAPSTAPTKPPTTYSGGTADSSSVRENGSHLTASQKIDYENFLYGAALRVLGQYQRRQPPALGREQAS